MTHLKEVLMVDTTTGKGVDSEDPCRRLLLFFEKDTYEHIGEIDFWKIEKLQEENIKLADRLVKMIDEKTKDSK